MNKHILKFKNYFKPMLSCVVLIALFFKQSNLSAQFTSTFGPHEGRPYQVINEGNTCYITTSNGLYRTEDNGEHFTRCEIGEKFYEALGIALDHNEIFLGSLTFGNSQKGFFYSQDKGQTWTKKKIPEPNWYPYEMAYENGELLGTYNNELYSSKDQGDSWQKIQLPKKPRYIELIRSNNNYFFVSDYKNIFRRSVKDTIWELIFSSSNYFFDLHVSDSVIIVLPANESGQLSYTNGNTWSKININGANTYYFIADFNDTKYYSGSESYKSIDRGLHWFQIPVSEELRHFNPFIRIGKQLCTILNTSSIYKTKDEFKSIEHLGTGLNSASVFQILKTDSFLFARTTNNIWRYNHKQHTWTNHPIYHSNQIKSMFQEKDKLFLTYLSGHNLDQIDFNGNFIKSTPDVSNFNTRMTNLIGSFSFGNKILLVEDGIEMFTDDNGLTWRNTVFSNNPASLSNIKDLTKYQNKALIRVLKESPDPNNYFYTSLDLEHWTELPIKNKNEFLPSDIYMVSDGTELIFYQRDINYIYWKYNTTDSTLIKCKGLEFANTNSIVKNQLTKVGANTLCLNTSSGIYLSYDTGHTWKRFYNELQPTTNNYFNDQILIGDSLYFACNSIGVIKISKSDIKIDSTVHTINTMKSMSNLQIIPNPSRGEFILQFRNTSDFNGLKIYNFYGQEIKFKVLNQNEYQIMIRLENGKTGIYFLVSPALKEKAKFKIIE